MKYRLKAAWSCVRDRPVIFGLRAGAEVYLSDAATAANYGLHVVSCDYMKMYVTPGTIVDHDGVISQVDGPAWWANAMEGDD